MNYNLQISETQEKEIYDHAGIGSAAYYTLDLAATILALVSGFPMGTDKIMQIFLSNFHYMGHHELKDSSTSIDIVSSSFRELLLTITPTAKV